ncbi:unnamed protein product [Choristocarpus tenellus]
MAVEREKSGKMKTRSLPSELMWSLSGSKNMSALLQTFCVPVDGEPTLLLVAIGMEEHELHLILTEVQGERCSLDSLGEGYKNNGALRERLKGLYKISDDELEMASMEDCVVSRMAVKDH